MDRHSRRRQRFFIASSLRLPRPERATPCPAVQAAGKATGVTVAPAQASTGKEIEPVFDLVRQLHAGALIMLPDPLFYAEARHIAVSPSWTPARAR